MLAPWIKSCHDIISKNNDGLYSFDKQMSVTKDI